MGIRKVHRVIQLVLIASLLAASTALAVNENTTIVLHAQDGVGGCDEPQKHGMDCVNGRPALDIAGMQLPSVYVMLRNYDEMHGLQCAFDWPLEWTYIGGIWDCRPGALVVVPTAPGPLTGTLVAVFNCVLTGDLITVGQMIFTLPQNGSGCLSIIESALVEGTHVINCDSKESTHVDSANWGRVCVGAGGYDACFPASTPVESVTWGAIKGQYR